MVSDYWFGFLAVAYVQNSSPGNQGNLGAKYSKVLPFLSD